MLVEPLERGHIAAVVGGQLFKDDHVFLDCCVGFSALERAASSAGFFALSPRNYGRYGSERLGP